MNTGRRFRKNDAHGPSWDVGTCETFTLELESETQLPSRAFVTLVSCRTDNGAEQMREKVEFDSNRVVLGGALEMPERIRRTKREPPMRQADFDALNAPAISSLLFCSEGCMATYNASALASRMSGSFSSSAVLTLNHARRLPDRVTGSRHEL